MTDFFKSLWYNISEETCLQGFPSAIFQRERRFGEDKARGNGSCRQNYILSRFNVIIKAENLCCKGFRMQNFNGHGDPVKKKIRKRREEADVKRGLNHII